MTRPFAFMRRTKRDDDDHEIDDPMTRQTLFVLFAIASLISFTFLPVLIEQLQL